MPVESIVRLQVLLLELHNRSSNTLDVRLPSKGSLRDWPHQLAPQWHRVHRLHRSDQQHSGHSQRAKS